MKKLLVVGVIVLFLSVSVIPLTGTTDVKQITLPTTSGDTLYVGGSGPNNYTKIQDAINDSENGDTVFVYNGTYYEHLKVDKSIDLIGENKAITVVDGSKYGYVIDITADNITLKGFTITNSGSGVNTGGIVIGWSDNNIIKNNIMSNNGDGICLLWSSYNIIIDNRIINNVGIGIFSHGDNNIFTSNNVSQNTRDGMRNRGNNNSILNNTISSNSHYGILFDCNPNRFNIIARNHIVNNGQLGFGIWFGDNNTVKENVIGFNSIGIRLSYTKDNHIYHNNFIDNNLSAYDKGNNTWDNGFPSYGNYWDDYNGTDSDGDGIGDTPYPIPGDGNEDRYPLMEPYGMTKLTIMSIGAGLFKSSASIKNIGNKTAFNVKWNITIDGGIILVGRYSSGTIPNLLPDEEVTIATGIILGFGKIMITVAVWADNAPLVSKSTPGFLLLFFIQINPGGWI